jgi:nucleoside 2-deoxyribosyltransferase
MKFYVAAYNQDEARAVGEQLKAAGHTLTSSWLGETLVPETDLCQGAKQEIATRCVKEVLAADVLVLLASPRRVPGGKFVEVGTAIASGKPVYVLGHRENMLMWHPLVSIFASVEDLVRWAEINQPQG